MILENGEIKIEDLPEFDSHELVVKLNEPEVGLHGFIVIHRIDQRYPALGATRLWEYLSEKDALRDALRLSKLMSYKSALAGLPYTGAKGVLMANPKALGNRKQLFRTYARKVNELQGKFITGTDVGVNNHDIRIMSKVSHYIIGHGINTAYYTAVGVLYGIQVALERVFGSADTSKRSFAIQGVGKTGHALLKLFYKKSFKIYVSDVNPRRTKYMKFFYPAVEVVDPTIIHKQDVDVFCPCALSHSLNYITVPELCCSIVAGAANNQLERAEIGEMLRDRGILYAPDAVINAGGLISVVDQFEHGRRHSVKRIMQKLGGVKERLALIFDESKQKRAATNMIATELITPENVFVI